MHGESLIEVKNLVRGYNENPHLTFNNFNLEVKRGDFCVLMGKSGSGKSSLVKLLIGQEKSPTQSVFYKKEDLGKYTDTDWQLLRRKMGIIFQEYKLIEHLPVKVNVTYPLALYGLGETIIESKYAKLKTKMKLESIENTLVKYLSSGEKQKICLARALIHDPEIIIADEPTGNLDWEHTQEVANLLIQANQEGKTILLITHDIHLVNYLKEHHAIRVEMMK